MKTACACVALLAAILLAGCSGPREVAAASDPDLEKEIGDIRAIDNHAHPVRAIAPGEAPDRGFDALPVDNMEPSSEPVNLRAGSSLAADAARALYGSADRNA